MSVFNSAIGGGGDIPKLTGYEEITLSSQNQSITRTGPGICNIRVDNDSDITLAVDGVYVNPSAFSTSYYNQYILNIPFNTSISITNNIPYPYTCGLRYY